MSPASTIENHTIPPFYACYLLASLNPARARTYIGSTPDPPRRIKQHNGLLKGGATKTRMGRPWGMEANVWGFPSKLVALQFEWAWQNPHLSRHLHVPTTDPKAKAVPKFPKNALSNTPQLKMQVLRYMLGVAPWAAYPLGVTLYSEKAEGWWERAVMGDAVGRTEAAWRKLEKSRAGADRGEDTVVVKRVMGGVDGMRGVKEGEEGVGKIVVDDVAFFLPHWEQYLSLTPSSPCALCSLSIPTSTPKDQLGYLICPSPACSIYHLRCLASHFLSHPISPSTSTSATPPLLPARSTCPKCERELHWLDLVRGCYRRCEEMNGSRKGGRKVAKRGKAVVEDEQDETESESGSDEVGEGVSFIEGVDEASEGEESEEEVVVDIAASDGKGKAKARQGGLGFKATKSSSSILVKSSQPRIPPVLASSASLATVKPGAEKRKVMARKEIEVVVISDSD